MDNLQDAYKKVCENAKASQNPSKPEKSAESQKLNESSVKGADAVGSNASGEFKVAKSGGPDKTHVKKPVEGEKKINPGHGKIKTSLKENSMLPNSKFDELFKRQIVNEEDIKNDESPLEVSGAGEFDEDQGDFPVEGSSDDTTGDEVDVATELRLVIDRLTQVAEKLGAFDSEMDEADSEVDSLDGDDGALDESPLPEAVQSKFKVMKDGKKHLQSKNHKVKSAFEASGKKASATGGPGKGAADGKLSPARKTTFGPNMSMKADTKSAAGKPGAGLFDTH